MTTFITRYDTSGTGVRLAVKDLIDMEGEPTTAGCRAVAKRARPAERDAACLAGARAAGARIVGRTNLHELALGVTGINPWYGTPVNPLDPTRVPGGSSSGSAVAVATHEADVAYGSDTGGSVRIPSACCGTAGLKTTSGRIPLEGVGPSRRASTRWDRWPATWRASWPAWSCSSRASPFRELGEVRIEGKLPVEADPAITSGLSTRWLAGWLDAELPVPGWDDAGMQAGLLLVVEAWHTDRALVAEDPEGIGDDVRARLELGAAFDDAAVRHAWAVQRDLAAALERAFAEVDFLVTPTLTIFPPPLEDGDDLLVARCTCR